MNQHTKRHDQATPQKTAEAIEGPGQWVTVWLPEGSRISFRSAKKFRDYQRQYMRKDRAKQEQK